MSKATWRGSLFVDQILQSLTLQVRQWKREAMGVENEVKKKDNGHMTTKMNVNSGTLQLQYVLYHILDPMGTIPALG